MPDSSRTDEPMTFAADHLAGRQVCVAGLGVSGPPAARTLAARGAQVIVVDSRGDPERRQLAAGLAELGVTVRLGESAAGLPSGTELVGSLRPVLPDGSRQQWLAVTGTNGKTTTVRMLAAMLAAAGHRSIAAGNVGTSAVEAVTEPEPYPVIAVELSSFQLHWSSTVRPLAAAVLNVAAHHLDWHGDIESYARDKGRIDAAGTIAICNADDERSVALAAAAPAAARVVAFRLGPPGPGELGVAGDALVDRAFAAGARLAFLSDVRPPAPHNV